ncbi:uncharacterized protein ARMOST_16785 [Armillaria ostoyae]|uniref:Uncharacterized protein n=1 Tax=Armillaria ostoyae TaxID=47428 RepID=A0A284RX54_ARMOS|nr:uncharacterized protein ARMOST_16785 [Armillaria ostoyae]
MSANLQVCIYALGTIWKDDCYSVDYPVPTRASLRGSPVTTCDVRITAEESVLGNESSRSHRHATLVYGSLDSTYLHPMCAQRKAQNDHLYRHQNSIEQSPLKKVASTMSNMVTSIFESRPCIIILLSNAIRLRTVGTPVWPNDTLTVTGRYNFGTVVLTLECMRSNKIVIPLAAQPIFITISKSGLCTAQRMLRLYLPFTAVIKRTSEELFGKSTSRITSLPCFEIPYSSCPQR